MHNRSSYVRIGVIFCALFLLRCSLVGEKDQKRANASFIVTPVASYSTLKARNLAQKYKDNLEHVVVDVVRNPTTGKLQFANNIASTGGIGFFTHSASTAVDERYLELILAVPEVFDEKIGFNSKIDRLLSQYGVQLLEILLKDSAIYGDPEVAGYGLNFSWRNLQGQPGSQIVFERAVLYIKKDEARKFVDDKLSKEALLSGAAIFAMRGEEPAQHVAYVNREIVPTSDRTGREENPPESTITALKAGVTERDISSEKDAKADEKKQETSQKPAAGKKTEGTRVSGSDGPKKEPQAPGLVPKKQAQEASEKPAVLITKEKTELPPTTGRVGGQSPAVTSGPEESASARPSRGSDVQNAKGVPSAVKESPETPGSRPLPNKGSQEMEKQGSRDVQPPLSSVQTNSVPAVPNQGQVDKSGNTALNKQKVLESKPARVADEVKAQEGKEAKEKPAQIPAPAPTAKLTEQPANKIAPREAETVQEAALRKDLPQEVTGQGARDAGPAREDTQKSREAPARKSIAGDQVREKTKEIPERGLSTPNIQSDSPAAQAKAPQTGSEVRVALKSVEGYAVQLSFPQRADAQRWSETLSHEGYTTSITSIGEANAVRLRVGSFSSPEAAKILLGRLQKQGLTGFVIQVPKG